MNFITIIYLFYTFVAFYFLFLFVIIYLRNFDKIYEFIKPNKIYSLSIVVPCYNESDSIGKTIEHLVSSSYAGLKKIYVVDDCSKDSSFKIIQAYAKKYPDLVVALQTPKNTGCAAGSKNYGAQFVKTELVGFTDADSYPAKDAIYNMVGFFNDPKIGAVTSKVLVHNKNNLLEIMQAIEYKMIAFTRRLLGFIGAIYVTNGPLSIYRKKAFDEVNGFDAKNLTEDIEITWHLVKKKWEIAMSMLAEVYTTAPSKYSVWYNQRIRWNVGGIQTIEKYKETFFRHGMLGLFILPFFVISWLLGLVGLGFLGYRIFNFFLTRYFTFIYSFDSGISLVTLSDFSLPFNILFFFGIVLFIFGLIFTYICLYYSREKEFKNHGIYHILMYSIFYLLVYPILLIASGYKYLKGKTTW